MELNMIWQDATLRRWGRSIGLVVPRAAINRQNLKEGDIVKIAVLPKASGLVALFGSNRSLPPASTVLKKLDKEMWDD